MISSPYYCVPSPLSPSSYDVVFQPFVPLIHPRIGISQIKQALLRDMILTNYYHNANLLIDNYKQSLEHSYQNQISIKRDYDALVETSRSSLSSKRRKLCSKEVKVTEKNVRPDYVQSFEPSKTRCVGDASAQDDNSFLAEYHYKDYDIRTLQEFSYLKQTTLGKKWYSRCEELVQFKQENGHCDVPHGYKRNKQLGAWVNTQRSKYRNSLLSREFIECLEKLGFEWNPSNKLSKFWNQRYEELAKYSKINGHCEIPILYNDNKELALWALNQRYYFRNTNKESQSELFAERKERLKRIGFDGTYGNKSCSL